MKPRLIFNKDLESRISSLEFNPLSPITIIPTQSIVEIDISHAINSRKHIAVGYVAKDFDNFSNVLTIFMDNFNDKYSKLINISRNDIKGFKVLFLGECISYSSDRNPGNLSVGSIVELRRYEEECLIRSSIGYVHTIDPYGIKLVMRLPHKKLGLFYKSLYIPKKEVDEYFILRKRNIWSMTR